MLLSEFDFEKDAVINPDIVHKPVADFPEAVISIFSHQLFGRVVEALGGVQIAETHDVDGVWPVYAVQYGGHRFAMYKARLGAPACVGGFEDIIPMGARRIILLGTAAFWIGALTIAALSFLPVPFGMRAQATTTHRRRITLRSTKSMWSCSKPSWRSTAIPMCPALPGQRMPFTGRPGARSPSGKKWAPFAWKWNVRRCRQCATFAAWSFSSFSMPATAWITDNGTPEASAASRNWTKKRELPCWLLNWPAQSRKANKKIRPRGRIFLLKDNNSSPASGRSRQAGSRWHPVLRRGRGSRGSFRR